MGEHLRTCTVHLRFPMRYVRDKFHRNMLGHNKLEKELIYLVHQ